MENIKRKTMLYKTGVEYGDYTINHVLGCSHGCKFPCYAFMMAKRFGRVQTYEDWINPKIAVNTLEILDNEIPKLKDDISSVQLCFTTDPFMAGYEDVSNLSIKIIQKLNDADIKCNILTKGILPIELSQYSKDNEYGITLISLDESYREKMEPGAASYTDRIENLRKLHEGGCKTWISMEPYPTPNLVEQSISDILNKISFVDKIIFGRTNYSKEVSAYNNHVDFYNTQAHIVIDFCEQNHISYHIKKGTIR